MMWLVKANWSLTHLWPYEHTHLQISKSSDPGACVCLVLPQHHANHLSVDVLAGDGGQVATRELVLAEKLQQKHSESGIINIIV